MKKVYHSTIRESPFHIPSQLTLTKWTGAGKSSFINSVDSVFSDYVSQIALSGRGTGSLTRVFTKYEVPSLEKVFLLFACEIIFVFGAGFWQFLMVCIGR